MTIHVYDDGNDVLRVEEELEVPVLDAKGKPTGKTEPRVARTGFGWVSAMTHHFDRDDQGDPVGKARKMTEAEREAYVRSLLPAPAPAAATTPNPKPLMTL